ncbi:unnamed protein product [Sympodiomycopsis kandeliae]
MSKRNKAGKSGAPPQRGSSSDSERIVLPIVSTSERDKEGKSGAPPKRESSSDKEESTPKSHSGPKFTSHSATTNLFPSGSQIDKGTLRDEPNYPGERSPEWAMYLKLGKVLAGDSVEARNILMTPRTEFRPTLYTHSDLRWIKIMSAPNWIRALALLQPTVATHNQYGLMRALISLLAFRLGSAGDVKLTAVRISKEASVAWRWAGDQLQEDNSCIVKIRPDIDTSADGMQKLFETFGAQAFFWELTGDLSAVAFVHIKDLAPVVKPTAGRKEITEKHKRDIIAALACVSCKPESKARWSAQYFNSQLEFAHVYHATRGLLQMREFSTMRELPSSVAAEEDHDLGAARNAILLSKSAHRAFDQKKAFIFPFPNAGFLGDGQVRRYDEQFIGLVPWTQKRRGKTSTRLAAAQQLKWIACDADGESRLSEWEDTTFLLDMSQATDPVDQQWIQRCGPAASHIGYAAATRFWGRPGILHEECFEFIRKLTAAHFPEERDLQSKEGVIAAAGATGSAATSNAASDDEG